MRKRNRGPGGARKRIAATCGWIRWLIGCMWVYGSLPLLYGAWLFRYAALELQEMSRRTFDRDVVHNNRLIQAEVEELERQRESGEIPEHRRLNGLPIEKLEGVLDVAREEQDRELDRRDNLVSRSGSIGTAASILLALATALVPFGTPFAGVQNALWVQASGSWIVLLACYLAMLGLGLGSLIWGSFLCLSVLQAGTVWRVPTLEFLPDPKTGDSDPGYQLTTIKSLLYVIARNQKETQIRLNRLDAAVRHIQDGFLCLLTVVCSLAASRLLQWLLQG